MTTERVQTYALKCIRCDWHKEGVPEADTRDIMRRHERNKHRKARVTFRIAEIKP